MDIVLDLIKTFGLPTTLLLMALWHHVRVVGAKDAKLEELAAVKDEEIKRVNEARLAEAQAAADRMMGIAQEFTHILLAGLRSATRFPSHALLFRSFLHSEE